jgi:serine-type D-Ala-D-Ala carboxypeptidase (penicillin-binding protein 5/6)
VTSRRPSRAALRVAAPAALVPALVAALTIGTSPAAAARPSRPVGPPAIQARAAILVQPDTGDIVYARNADQRRLIASTTKLMTALITLERSSLSDVFTTVPYRADPAESVMGLHPGERMTVRDLLRGLLIVSANDAAATLSADIAGSRKAFVRMMNARAAQLGLRDTHYANPIGLDQDGNYSSAADLVKLTLILRRFPFFRLTTDTERVVVRSGTRPRVLVNRNLLLREVPSVDGVKTGHTNRAGYILVGSATRAGVPLVSAVLGDPSERARDGDTLTLLRYGQSRYRRVAVVGTGQELGRASIRYQGSTVPLVAQHVVHRIVRTGDPLSTSILGARRELTGPVAQGTKVGDVLIHLRGRVVTSVPLVTGAPVRAATFGERLMSWLSGAWPILLLAVVALGSLPLVLLRRRAVRRRRRTREAREAEIA